VTLPLVRELLLWCTVLDYGVLLAWFIAFSLAHDWMRRLHGRWFRLSDERFDAIHYAGMTIYKIGILLFNLIPYVALRIVERHGA
jgi:hypothetical protein